MNEKIKKEKCGCEHCKDDIVIVHEKEDKPVSQILCPACNNSELTLIMNKEMKTYYSENKYPKHIDSCCEKCKLLYYCPKCDLKFGYQVDISKELENSIKIKELLNSGKMFNYLYDIACVNHTRTDMFNLLRCLSDMTLLVPMNSIVNEEDEEQFSNAEIGSVVTLKNEIRMKADILKNNENKLCFPIFTAKNEIEKDYFKSFSWIELSILECISLARNNNVDNIIVNAFSHKFELTKELMDIIEAITKNKVNDKK